MSRYIDADDITKKIQSRIEYFEMYYPNDTKNISELQNCLELVNETPTADVKHIDREEWISKDISDFVYCSKCDYKEWYSNANNYCPNCGARMKGEQTE